MKYDIVTLYLAEKDVREDRSVIEKMIAENDNKVLSDEDRMYVEACKSVLTQKTDHTGRPF